MESGSRLAQALADSLGIDNHIHQFGVYQDDSHDSKPADGTGTLNSYGETEPAGGYTPAGTISDTTIGTGSTASGTVFVNPYYGVYIWNR